MSTNKNNIFFFYVNFTSNFLLKKLFLYVFRFSLEEINFGDCLLKTKGAIILGEALSDEHLALETLILDNNEIGPNGGFCIASAMYNKEQLQTLNLNGNQVRSQNCRFFVAFII